MTTQRLLPLLRMISKIFIFLLNLCPSHSEELTPLPRFLLTPIQSNTGHPVSITLLSTPFMHPLCITSTSVNNLPMLAHKICKSANFQTFSSFSLVNPSSVSLDTRQLSNSNISCSLTTSYTTSCSVVPMEMDVPCSYLFNLVCGSCHSHTYLTSNSSVQLKSPLYPVLQPGMVCQYDLELDKEVSADISVNIEDLSLPPANYVSSHPGHCITSYLHIMSGITFHQLTILATLCGDTRPDMFMLKQQEKVVRLQLVTGPGASARNRRGFRITVRVSPSLDIIDLAQVGIFVAYFLGLLIFVAAIVAGLVLFQKCKTQKRKRKPRRGVTWHGSAPQPGQSLHIDRTVNITRQLFNVEEDRTDNVYSSMDEGEIEYITQNATTADIQQLPLYLTPPAAFSEAMSQTHEEAAVDGTYYTINSSQSSTDSLSDNSLKVVSCQPSLCPPVPSRPLWTLQGGSPSPPLYCVSGQHPDKYKEVKARQVRAEESDKGSEVKKSHSYSELMTRTSLRQSLSDTTRKMSLFLARVSHSRQWGQSVDEEGVKHLICDELDEVFY